MSEIEKLIEGYKKFYRDNFVSQNKDIFKNVQTSQSPKTLIIACSDSRVDPAILTNAEIGDIFVVRNVANLVPPYQPKWDSDHGTSAAIEFAVNYLHVKHIVILGHSNCGGIRAIVDNDIDANTQFSFLTNWINLAKDIKSDVQCNIEDKYDYCEQAGIKLSLKNLMTFPWVKDKVESNQLKIHGWYFSIRDASLSTLNNETGSFETIKVL